MKRGGPLKRKTGLRSSRPLVATTRLQRSSSIARTVMARKRPVATPEEREARRLVRVRSGGLCEVCGRAQATDAHHRVNRSQGGRWEISNLLHLDRGCHQKATVNPVLAKSRGWSLAGHNDPSVSPVWLAGRGWSLLRADGGIAPYRTEAA